MAASTKSSESDDKSMSGALDRCLKTLRRAESDTERLAALFLITKLAKAESMKAEDRQRIFEAVGFQFINRLLHTESPPQDCDEHMFRSLALTLLACFSTDPTLASHQEMLDKVPILKETILLPKTSPDASSNLIEGMVSDAYDILQAMTATEEGRERLCADGLTESLVTVLVEGIQGYQRGHTILCILLYHSSDRLWSMHSTCLNHLFNKLAQDFDQQQDEDKFQTCRLLNSLMSVASSVPPTMPPWSIRISTTLFSVLKNKLGETQRDSCLQLASTMVYHYGTPWVFCQQDRKFFLLLVNLASIEVRMILETMDSEKQLAKAEVLCSCFGILEQCIQSMVSTKEIELSPDEVHQLHGILTGAFGAAIFHLKSATVEQVDDPVVISCVRALFMWLAEETAELKDEVTEILPFLIDFSEMSERGLPSGGDLAPQLDLHGSKFYLRLREDLIKLFLPGLCHLTAERESRNVIVSHNGIEILVTYMKKLLANIHDNETSLITLCNIFLNVTLQDPDAVRGQEAFRDLLETLGLKLSSEEIPSTLLHLHFNLVLVTILRILQVPKDAEIFLKDTVSKIGKTLGQILRSGTHKQSQMTDEDDEDETFKNLLCLILQCLIECTQSHSWVTTILLDANLNNPPRFGKGMFIQVSKKQTHFQGQLFASILSVHSQRNSSTVISKTMPRLSGEENAGGETGRRCRKPKINKTLLPVKATYLFYIGALVTLFPVIPVYLSYLGLSPSQIGLIRGAEPFLDFLVSPVWGSMADKFSIHKNLVLFNVFGVGGAYFSTIFVPGTGQYNITLEDGEDQITGEQAAEHWSRTRWTFTACLMLIACGQMFNAGVVPLMDANTEEMVKHHKGASYGRQRLWGSMGGMIFSVTAGAIMDVYSKKPFFLHEYSPAYIIFFFFIILTVIPVWNIKFAPHKPPETMFRNVKVIFKNPRIVAFFLVMCTFGFSYGQVDTFKFLFLDQLGSPHILRSLCPAANCLAELFLLYYSKQIIWRIGHENAFMLVLAAYATRFLAYSFLWNPWWILPVELLHGFCFGILWPNVTAFCNAVAPPGMAATMQSLAFALTAGLSEGIGTILGGLFYERFGARNLFRAMAGACVCVLIAYKIFCCFFEPIKPGSGGKTEEDTSAVQDQEGTTDHKGSV